MGQSITRAEVEIGGSRTTVWTGDMRLYSVAATDPGDKMKNLLSAHEARLKLDLGALVKRKFVVNDGHLRGLELGSARDAEGIIERPDSWWGRRFADLGESWFDAVGDRLEEHYNEESLHTVRLGKQLMQDWPVAYKELEARAEQIEQRGRYFKGLVEEARRNPLKNIDSVIGALNQLDALQRDLAAARGQVDRLHARAYQDHRALEEARRKDLERIRRELELKELDAKALTYYLLGPEINDRIAETLEWVQFSRRLMPAGILGLGPQRMRGEVVKFPDRNRRPNFLIRRLEVDGLIRRNGREYPLSGELTNVTSEPTWIDHPAALAVAVQGPAPVQVRLEWDRRGAEPVDRLAIRADDIPLGGQIWGDRQRLALKSAPSRLSVAVEAQVFGDKLQGEIVIRHRGLNLQPIGSEPGKVAWADAWLTSAVAEIRTVETRIGLGGEIDKPQLELRSDLGERLAAAVVNSTRRTIKDQQLRLAQRLDRVTREQITRFDQLVFRKRRELLEKMDLTDRELAALRTLIGKRFGPAVGIFGDRSPLKGILNR